MVDLPIKKIILYKHGVGYVERRGKLKADKLTLQFKRGNMNDVLKSLVVLDKTGKVTGVSYESHEEASEKLKNALVVPEGNAVLGLLKSLTGNNVVIDNNTKIKFTGQVVGIQETKETTNQQGLELNLGSEKRKTFVSLLDESGKTHFIDIDEIKSVEIVDENVLRDLRYFLELSAAERKHDVKSVSIHLSGNAMHDLSLSCIIEMPVWRASYRFVQGEKTSLLQGWGIMDNSLEEDLEDVEVSLVAGQPISFVYDFYSPPLTHRPFIQEQPRAVKAPVELEGALSPVVAESYDMEEEAAYAPAGALKGKQVMAEMSRVAKPVPIMRQEAVAAFGQSTSVQTKAQELGAFFRYDILNPVTIKRGESAMLPILQETLNQKDNSQKILVYNKNTNPKNPMLSIRFKNNTGLTLERGPLTVYDQGMYVGEAILPFTPEGGEQFIVYAVELGVEVNDTTSTEDKFKSSYLSGAYFIKMHYQKTKTTYVVNNKTKKSQKVMLEHPKWSAYELVDTKKPDEETDSFHRWNIDLPAGKAIKFEVTQARQISYSEDINNMSVDTLEYYFKYGQIDRKLKDQISQVVERTEKIRNLEQEKENLDDERERFLEEQERLRKNIAALSQGGSEGELREKYVNQLDKQEERVQKINNRITEIDDVVLKLQKYISDLIKSFGK
ncbi:MAG TPA: hypothetical protein VI912_00840 [Candidatus Bilamarchaeaceae archaeon]|nr:hypothetical protein [Candidatus Bilamarchaeaceae archaeon]